jgi:hypothetical protein
MKVLEIEHVRNGKVIWQSKNLYNTLHTEGENLLLQVLFTNDGMLPPVNYYLGLDNRPVIAISDTMASLQGEPVGFGYVRQAVSSATGWQIGLTNGVYAAVTEIVTFTAVGGDVGPVSNLFLTDKGDNTGTLISSVPLSQPGQTIADGDAVNMRMSMSLQDIPPCP